MLRPVFRAGETYAIDPAISPRCALAYWFGGARCLCPEDGGRVLGSYYICPNQQGGGAHVCNCGFVTAQAAQGKEWRARCWPMRWTVRAQSGFRAMQFNFVIHQHPRGCVVAGGMGSTLWGACPAPSASRIGLCGCAGDVSQSCKGACAAPGPDGPPPDGQDEWEWHGACRDTAFGCVD
jgi:hypothetical protein